MGIFNKSTICRRQRKQTNKLENGFLKNIVVFTCSNDVTTLRKLMLLLHFIKSLKHDKIDIMYAFMLNEHNRMGCLKLWLKESFQRETVSCQTLLFSVLQVHPSTNNHFFSYFLFVLQQTTQATDNINLKLYFTTIILYL